MNWVVFFGGILTRKLQNNLCTTGVTSQEISDLRFQLNIDDRLDAIGIPWKSALHRRPCHTAPPSNSRECCVSRLFLASVHIPRDVGGRQPCGGIPSVASKTLAILNYNQRRESRAVKEKQKKSQGTREELSEEGAFGECGERSAAAFALLGDIFDSRRGN